MLLYQAFPFLIGTPMILLVIYTYLPYGSTTSIDTVIIVPLLFILFSFAIKITITHSLRHQIYLASEEGIASVRLSKNGTKETTSIRWNEVVKVDMYDILPEGMGIDGIDKRLIIPTKMENLESLFEIMRRKVPRQVVKKSAIEYIEKPNPIMMSGSISSISDSNARISYSRFYKAFFVCVIVALYVILYWAILFAPSSASTPEWITIMISFAVGIIPVPFLLELFLSYYRLSDIGIERHAFWGGRSFIPWDGVDSIVYVSARRRRGYQIRGAGKKLELSDGLEGLPSFARMVIAHVPPDKWATTKMDIINTSKLEI